MKHIAKSLRIFALCLLAGSFLALGTSTLLPQTGEAAVMTFAECHEKFNGKNFPAGAANNLQKLYEQYESSGCDSSEDGPCKESSGSVGKSVSCFAPGLMRDCAQYDGKGSGQGPGDVNISQFNRSDCPSEKNGPCTLTSASQGFVIKCAKASDKTSPPRNNNGGNNTDPGCEDACTNVGNDFNPEDCSNGLDGECEVVDIVVIITNTLSALAATVIVAMIVWGGIQYSMAGADASKVQAAKQKIMNALIALLLLIFGFSIIQWLVPGGLI